MKKSSFFTKPINIVVLALFCCFLWGSASPAIKIGYRLFRIAADDAATQLLFAGIRFILSGLMVILWGCITEKRFLKLRRESWGNTVVLAMVQTVLQYTFFYIGLAHTTGVKMSIIVALGNFLAILFSCLFFRQEALTRQKVLGCLFGFAGIILVNTAGGSLSGGFSFLGEGFALLSATSFGITQALIKRFSKQEHPVTLCGYQFFIGGIIMAGIGSFTGGQITVISGGACLLMFYLCLMTALSFSLWSVLLKHNPVSKVLVFGFASPIFGTLLSAIFLNEAGQLLSWQIPAALLLVCAGVYIVNRSVHKRAEPLSEESGSDAP